MKKLPKIITIEEFNKMLETIEKEKPCSFKEYELAMILGFKAGMRISEIVGFKDRVPKLTADKIDLQAHTIRIESGKGEKDRVVPCPKEINERAIKLLPLNLSRRSLQDFVTKLGFRVLNKKISFHSLRHGFGSHLANSGRPLHEIQMLMGHSRLDTTGIYLHANPKVAIDNARELF
jgi:site-specific recombinase XerD